MRGSNKLVGLFFSDENNLVFKKIRHFHEISEKKATELEMLTFKYFGPVYMTAAEDSKQQWKIDFVEASLSLKQGTSVDGPNLQSFFTLNSNYPTEKGEMTHLSAFISSPYTEDYEPLYEKLTEYIHPCLVQGNIYNKKTNGEEFKERRFIKEELGRGLELLNYNLGSARKMYLKEHQKFYCIGLIENIYENGKEDSKFFTFDKNEQVVESIKENIPSFYIISTLPNYYETLLANTVELFNISAYSSNLRRIDLSSRENQVVYIEEYIMNGEQKRSIGVLLIPTSEIIVQEGENISMYRKRIRKYLDNGEIHDKEDFINAFNSRFSSQVWDISTEQGLNEIKMNLDK
jgi:hypothetical protein